MSKAFILSIAVVKGDLVTLDGFVFTMTVGTRELQVHWTDTGNVSEVRTGQRIGKVGFPVSEPRCRKMVLTRARLMGIDTFWSIIDAQPDAPKIS